MSRKLYSVEYAAYYPGAFCDSNPTVNEIIPENDLHGSLLPIKRIVRKPHALRITLLIILYNQLVTRYFIVPFESALFLHSFLFICNLRRNKDVKKEIKQEK